MRNILSALILGLQAKANDHRRRKRRGLPYAIPDRRRRRDRQMPAGAA